MAWDFIKLNQEIDREFDSIQDHESLENFRVKYLGRKGIIPEIYASLSTTPPDQKPAVGKGANELKVKLESLLGSKRQELKFSSVSSSIPAEDISLPGVSSEWGHRHLLSQTIKEICQIFERMGFSIFEGPEIETEFNNFTALNIPIDHPSRDAFDTFYLDLPDISTKDRNLLLRSHTSPAQIRIMNKYRPPFAVVVPGKVYRPDAVDASHSFMFHQIEGLLVDEKVRFSDLKGLLTIFCQKLFNDKIRMRFRPHYFPFTEPSAEVDISCYICGGDGCSTCGRKGWLEILGCGMVHPKVFSAVGYPKDRYTGLAFGLGVERITMLKFGIKDIRILFENDVRFLKQF